MTTTHHTVPVPTPALFPTWGDGVSHARAELRAIEDGLGDALAHLQLIAAYLDRAPGPTAFDCDDVLPTVCGVNASDIARASELVQAIGEALDDLTA